MEKEKFHIEFVMGNASQNSLWRMISMPDGLSEWFADEVSFDEENNQYLFRWSKSEDIALVQFSKPMNVIRFRWLDEEQDMAYFEFAIHKLELSGGLTLEITDFATTEEKNDAITLWEKQVDELKRKLGI
ncbi:START-like domain-containing protein [Seramator thermalis]|jgi:uncharacterized protein YndB with AHSA1/START domain|uniref:START-like domain-containing protein n=1 Tax=Seramator thermalis TaxID=2496270 RepID=UPI0009CFB3F3|nr:START-like domain-containing protein [Seramator thermalis]MBP9031056.1 hypothetical protein [Dysgonamonadaceae bacterium]MBZ4657600.1 hypothetical protein [Methermicoccus sp.]OPZ15205.1 MAG: hypothetical protein BWZ06_00392 [Bacteroidetes bacterium ADurb.BinA261]HOT64804.1 START-like domain-containing protein [Dysgonamonadaceae bacterium]HOV36463.1 START-like domain-containing protein [Dysgonamonadaceae bacterium]